MPVLRPASQADASAIRSLLEREGLPTSDLASAQPEFIVACDGDEIVGIGALQRFGTTALLRSVAVTAEQRRAGLGSLIVQELERRARIAGIAEIVLLTQTAARFFERQGYGIIDRPNAPRAVQMSDEFRSLCPASAVCMSKALTDIRLDRHQV